MKKTTKKSPKASQRKAIKDLEVKSSKSGTVKGLQAARAESVKGGKQKPDDTKAGNVAAKWSVAQGAVA